MNLVARQFTVGNLSLVGLVLLVEGKWVVTIQMVSPTQSMCLFTSLHDSDVGILPPNRKNGVVRDIAGTLLQLADKPNEISVPEGHSTSSIVEVFRTWARQLLQE